MLGSGPRRRRSTGSRYLSGAGRLVIKDAIMMGAALVTMADSAKAYLRAKGAAGQAVARSRVLEAARA